MKIAIVGSRSFNDYALMKEVIDNYKEKSAVVFSAVVSGGARGADSLGERYAEENGLEKIIFKADWNKYGKRAGFIRNVDIIKNCDICFAFWDGESHGTKHDIDLCKEYGKDCVVTIFVMN